MWEYAAAALTAYGQHRTNKRNEANNAYANQLSAASTAKQMAFQERMSNTAHQRQVKDLKAAGINPILSAKLGGASTPQGGSYTGQKMTFQDPYAAGLKGMSTYASAQQAMTNTRVRQRDLDYLERSGASEIEMKYKPSNLLGSKTLTALETAFEGDLSKLKGPYRLFAQTVRDELVSTGIKKGELLSMGTNQARQVMARVLQIAQQFGLVLKEAAKQMMGFK